MAIYGTNWCTRSFILCHNYFGKNFRAIGLWNNSISNGIYINIRSFVDSGLGTALVQKKDADELDFTTVLCFNIFACLLVYCLLFFLAPAIASFYNLPDMIPLIRVLSITVIISGAKMFCGHMYLETYYLRSFFSQHYVGL